MRPTLKTTLLASMLIAAWSAPAESEPLRRHSAHVHSEARAFVAQDGDRIELQLQAPGANFAGFEHPPRTPDQHTTLDTALETLRAGAWLRTSAGADCSVVELRVEAPGFDIDASGDDHDTHQSHNDHDEHSHEHEDNGHDDHHDREQDQSETDHDGPGHAEFHVTVQLSCARPDRLEWVELNLFDDWPDNRRIQTDVLTATRQQRVDLEPGRTRIDLR